MKEKKDNFTLFSKHSRRIEFKAENSHLNSIEFSNDVVHLNSRDGKDIIFSEKDKPEFKSETGEKVIEYSGMATDHIAERSWAIVYFATGGYSPKHYHSKREEIYYITHGSAKLVIDGTEYQLEPGDSIAIKPNQKHQIFNTSTIGNLVLLVECTPAWAYEDHLVDKEELTTEIQPTKMGL